MMKWLISGCVVVIVTLAQSARGELKHTYQGEPFDEIVLGDGFTTEDFVTGFVEFGTEPIPFETFDADKLVDFSLSAGSVTIDSRTPGVAILAASFYFNSSGDLAYWSFLLSAGLDGISTSRFDDEVASDSAASGVGAAASLAQNQNLAGEWTAVPEPSTAVMWLLVGLTGSAVAWRRRRGAVGQQP